MNMFEMQREALKLLTMRLEPPESAGHQLAIISAGIVGSVIAGTPLRSMGDFINIVKCFVGTAYVLGQRGNDPVDLEAIFGDALSQEGG